jgi:hypothetical protein
MRATIARAVVRAEMSIPPEPNGRPSSARDAVPVPSSGERPGSTDSHQHNPSPSDLVPLGGSSNKRGSAGSDIAQFLAHPNAAANTDDSPTVITKNQSSGSAPPAVPVGPGPDHGEAPSVAGRRLGHFELIEAVGAGGMAAVLRARDLELGRIVALKILPPEAARDPESVTRFKLEARAAAALDHENIARVYFCGEDQGLHFIAFEFVEGENLRQLIDRRGVLPAAECVRYMTQVAAGLNHAAERGVVHRDIKPSNIIVTPDGRAKIVDMGLARHLGSEAVNGSITQSGVTLGTFDYISPEQALDPRRADVRSDIYSLGCTFYHALTGRPPVPEGTPARKLRAHQNDQPLDPRELNPAVPDELVAVLGRMMAKDPAVRYQTPTELIAHLKGLAERLHLAADVLGHDSAAKAVPAERHLLPEAPRIRPWWAVAVAAVVLAIAAFLVSTGNPGPAPGLPGTGEPPHAKADPPIEKNSAQPPVAAPADGPVQTVEQLVKKLEDPNTKQPIVLGRGTFDLTDPKIDHAVAFQGQKLELIGQPGGATRIILSAHFDRGTAGSLTLRATESLTVRNVWFDLKLDKDISVDTDGVTKPVGLRLDDARDVHLWDCVFAAAQNDRAQNERELLNHSPRAVAVTGAAQLAVTRCLFAPGAGGMLAPGGAQISVSDSGFAPSGAAVLLETAPGTDPPPPSEVRLDRSSFMLNPGCAAVETGVPMNGVPVNLRVTVSDCVFAPVSGPGVRPSPASEAAKHGVVVRALVQGSPPAGVQFAVPTGRTNAYYNTDPLGTLDRTFSFEDCKSAELAVEDKGHTELKQRPWSEPDPQTVASGGSPWRAFRLKVDADAALFTTDRPPVPLGAVFAAEGGLRRAYPDLYAKSVWPPPRPQAGEARAKVWVPAGKPEALGAGEFSELKTLLRTARTDDVILIRHTGELKVDNEELKAPIKPGEGEFRVTFRPEKGSAPVLVIEGDNEKDQTLFRLKSGEVAFEGLHFRLRPNRPRDGQLVAAVGIIGGKGCTFRNCAFTLAEEDDSKACAVHLPDVDKFMAMDPATRPVPKVIFDHCLIRGRGRAVWVEVSRPLSLEMSNTLTALDGPVFLAEAGGRSTGAAASTAKFTRVTMLAGGPVVEMRGGKTADAMRAAGLVPLRVDADRCLFVAVPGAGRPLVDLDGVDPTEWKSVLTWHVTDANRYANFESGAVLAAIRPGGDGIPKEWTRDDWIAHVGEPVGADKRFGQLTFATPITGLKDLSAVKPADAAAKTIDFPDLPGAKELDVGVDPAELKKLPGIADEP